MRFAAALLPVPEKVVQFEMRDADERWWRRVTGGVAQVPDVHQSPACFTLVPVLSQRPHACPSSYDMTVEHEDNTTHKFS